MGLYSLQQTQSVGCIVAIRIPTFDACLLSQPSKLRLFDYDAGRLQRVLSFSLPAGTSCPGKRAHGPNDICSACYAAAVRPTGRTSRYGTPVVERAQQQRWAWVLACMMTDAGVDSFVETLTYAIRKESKTKYFRIHDSGDFFNPRYIRAWIRICTALPEFKFWAPTRSYRIPRLAGPLQELAALPNVTVRPSALEFDTLPPTLAGFAAGSGAVKVGPVLPTTHGCTAPETGSVCQDCRLCWDAPAQSVMYHYH